MMWRRKWLRAMMWWRTKRLSASKDKGEAAIRAFVQGSYRGSQVFSFGAIGIHPRHLAIWIVTQTDWERDELASQPGITEKLRGCMLNAGYPKGAVPEIGFAFESEETVSRDWNGDWRSRVQ
jgi:hypothetical protein